jgi:hypothetical protein
MPYETMNRYELTQTLAKRPLKSSTAFRPGRAVLASAARRS